MELNREQIVKALEHCINDDFCDQCNFTPNSCFIHEKSLAIIRELTEEKERIAHESACHRQTVIDNLRESLEFLDEETERVRADTVRKFAERLKVHCADNRYWCEVIDRIAQELLEEDNRNGRYA